MEREPIVVEKQLPNSPRAEEGLLGCLIIDPDLISDIEMLVQPDDFYNMARQMIYRTITRLFTALRQPVDFITLCDELDAQGKLEAVGGASYITSLIHATPGTASVSTYAQNIAELSKFRKLIIAGQKIFQMGYDQEEDALATAEKLILDIGKAHIRSDLISIGAYTPEYLTLLQNRGKNESKSGISVGLRALDGVIGKLRPGKIYVPIAETGVGKTAICLYIAYKSLVKYGKRVAIFSLEMPKDEVLDRLFSIHLDIDSMDLAHGTFEGDRWDDIISANDELSALGLWFEYTPGIYLDELASIARRVAKRERIDLFVVDYTQLVRVRIDGKRLQPREQEVAEVARGLKELAGELGVPILAPAQVNRSSEQFTRFDDEATNLSYRIPTLRAVRESAELVQSADGVWSIAVAESDPTQVIIRVLKNRGGRKGDVKLKCIPSSGRYETLGTLIDEYGVLVKE